MVIILPPLVFCVKIHLPCPCMRRCPILYMAADRITRSLFGFSAGIMGLARAKLSMTAQLSSKYGYAFTYCLPTPDHGKGFLYIGNSSMGAFSAYKFTNMLRDTVNPSLYFLRLAAITVAGTPLRVGAVRYRVPTITDSGTVMSRLPHSVYTALRETFVKIMSKKYKQVPGNSILDTCFSEVSRTALLCPKFE